MIQKALIAAVSLSSCLIASPTVLGNEIYHLECNKSHLLEDAAKTSNQRNYAPDREVDILHLKLDVTPDFKKRTVAGKASVRFSPIAKPLEELKLDAVELSINNVTSTLALAGYHVTDQHLVISFKEPLPAGKEATVHIEYSAEPERGLYFRTPEMGYKDGESHLFTQGEPLDARYWYPSYDFPNEKFTTEVVCRVPKGMIVLSNGRKVSEQEDATTGLVATHWLQDKPHVNYLLTLVAGHFQKIEDRYKSIPMAFYTLPSDIEQAKNSFRNTKDMMEFFEKEIGVPYPWAKYDQICVNDFVAGGMENTSATTLTDRTLFSEASENIRSSDGLVAHELAHQWFGDLVTCKDWSHLWLNEGFATYYESLFDEHKLGRDHMIYGLYNNAREFLDRADDTRPIVDKKYKSPMERFGYLVYPKGSWVLHMLRSQLGPDLYRRCVQTFLERHQFGTVVTEDLNSVIEELSGRSFDQFFDQWVYHAHHPELEVKYSWDSKTKLAKVSVSQNQKLSETVLLFHFPLQIRFRTKSGTVNHHVTVKDQSEDFYIPLPEAPELVRIDPEYTLLAKVRFDVSDAMLAAMIADKSDVMGRLIAIEQLQSKKTQSAIDLLEKALRNDSFYGVRVEAARALKAIHTEPALEALANSTSQSDARVRQEVAIAIGNFYSERAFSLLLAAADKEKNPDIQASLVKALGTYSRPQVRELLVRMLKTDSYQNRLADAAVEAIRAQDDPSYIPEIRRTLEERRDAFTSEGLIRGFKALAYLARNEEEKQSNREYLIGFTEHKRHQVARAAIEALEILGDEKAIPVLTTFASARKDSPERTAADKAISAIRARRKSTDEFKDLRNEVLELKKENRDLRNAVEELKKKFEAGQSSEPKPKAQNSRRR